jgi:hypothetical protein
VDGQQKTVYWANAEAGYEHRFKNGLAISFAFGVTYAFGGSQQVCIDGCSPVTGTLFPTARVGVGWWF